MNAVAEYLRIFATGPEHAKTEKQIDRDLSLKKVVARVIIRKLRENGYLIASGERGYWVLGPTPTWEDVQAFMTGLNSLHSRAIKILAIDKPMRLSLYKKYGQMIREHEAQVELRI